MATTFTTAAAANAEFNVSAETGIITTGYSRQVTPTKTEIRDNTNETVAVSYTDTKASIKIDGYINGGTPTVAAALTVINDTSAYGLTGGTVLIDSISETAAQGEFVQVSIDATQYSGTLS